MWHSNKVRKVLLKWLHCKSCGRGFRAVKNGVRLTRPDIWSIFTYKFNSKTLLERAVVLPLFELRPDLLFMEFIGAISPFLFGLYRLILGTVADESDCRGAIPVTGHSILGARSVHQQSSVNLLVGIQRYCSDMSSVKEQGFISLMYKGSPKRHLSLMRWHEPRAHEFVSRFQLFTVCAKHGWYWVKEFLLLRLCFR